MFFTDCYMGGVSVSHALGLVLDTDRDRPLPRTVLQSNILPGDRETGLRSLAVLVVVVGALYFGRDVFVPLALAGLLSFALAPLIAGLRRRGIPRIPALITVVMLAFLGISVFGFVVAGQVSELGASLPRYEYNIREKIRSVQSSAPGGGLVERAAKVLRDLRADIEEASGPQASEDQASPLEPEASEPDPIPVQIRQPDPAPLQMLQTILGPLIEPLATTVSSSSSWCSCCCRGRTFATASSGWSAPAICTVPPKPWATLPSGWAAIC